MSLQRWSCVILLGLGAVSCRTAPTAKTDTAGLATTDGGLAVDGDGDGFPADEDCDDLDASSSPAAEEICDGVDNDCDGEIDEGVRTVWYADTDGDGFGDTRVSEEACSAPDGHVTNAADCDDTDAQVYPGAPEACDGIDNDCDLEVDEDGTQTWYIDGDGDGFGDPTQGVESCERPPDGVADGTDCDDDDAGVFPGAAEVCNERDDDCDAEVDEGLASTWYRDTDADGWGDVTSSTEACAEPPGYAADPGDCDDTDPAFHPGAPESDCTDPADYNCDGSVAYADADADGWAACTECDDGDPAVNPDAVEVCNGIDDDCDGDIDDADSSVDLGTAGEWYGDADGDGYGNPTAVTTACDAPSGSVGDDSDCDDGNAAVNPGATEVCNTIDDDCDGAIDDADSSVDLTTGTSFYGDADADGYGDAAVATVACAAPSGTVSDDADCDDTDSAVNPGATEVCNTVDDDCDGAVDDADSSLDASTTTAWYTDGDGDGYGSALSASSCAAPSGTSAQGTDCDDTDSAVNPGATEVCNTVDDDCDGAVDDADSSLDASTTTTWYTDGDGDGYGGASTTSACSQPSGTTATAADCDDTDSAVNPGATETCDGVDTDCDGSVDEGYSAVSASVAAASPTGSCNGNSNRSVTFTAASACGCPTVTLTGAFADYSDGSGGQLTAVSTSSSSLALQWDDQSSGGDCDLDIASSISWSASYSAGVMTVTVTDQITGYDAGNSIAAGYGITAYSTVLRSSGSGTNSYTYACP